MMKKKDSKWNLQENRGYLDWHTRGKQPRRGVPCRGASPFATDQNVQKMQFSWEDTTVMGNTAAPAARAA